MPTIRRCCIVGCISNSRQNPQLQFFQFPRADNPFHKLWKQACHASLSRILPFKKPVVCALHFHPNCIGGRRLTSSAVPSLRLEVPSNLKAVEQKAMLEEIERSRKCAYINAVVYEWIVRANLNPTLRGSITHGMIKEKAETAKQIIGSNSFLADNRWLNRFRETHLTGFAQKLASNQLQPLGPSLRIADIVQDLQHLFPPTTAERVANIEEMPEQYINYMQEYGDMEEDDDVNDTKEGILTNGGDQQQQQGGHYQYQQQSPYSNASYESGYSSGNLSASFDQFGYEKQQKDHYQQTHGHHNYQQSHRLQQHHQQQQYASQDQPNPNNGSSHRSSSRSPPDTGKISTPPRRRSLSSSPGSRHSSVSGKRSKMDTTNNNNRSPSSTRTPTPSNGPSEPEAITNHNESTADGTDEEDVPTRNNESPTNSQTNGDSNSLKSESTSNSPTPTTVNENSNDGDNDQDNENTSSTVHMNGHAMLNGHATSDNSSSPPLHLHNGKSNGHHHNGNVSPTPSYEVNLCSYKEALEYLKPLEDFALLRENFRAIGLISQLEDVLLNGLARNSTVQAS